MWDAFTSMPKVRVFGPPPTQPRTPTMSFTVEGMHTDDVARKLASEGLFVSSGDFYAATVCERYAIDSLVRVGCACYTSEEDVRRLIDAVSRL